jgi:Caspase domain/Domain of unknown function (DUF4384)
MAPRQLFRRWMIVVALFLVASMQSHAAARLRAPGGGVVRALVIGIDSYPNLPPPQQLGGAVADAADLSRALLAAGVNVQTLTNAAATRARLVGEMNRLVADSKSGDLVILTYSGHGMRVRAYPRWRGLDGSGVQTQIALGGYGRSSPSGHEIVVDRELRAWLARFDAKGVDVLVVMDSCYGGSMRAVAPLSGEIRIRALAGDADEQISDSFVGIEMSQREARTDVRGLPHVTFFAGATENAVVPEMTGIDDKSPQAPRGALSYFMARAIEGYAAIGDVNRERLFGFLAQNVRQKTNERQAIDLELQVANPAVMQKVVFRFGDDGPTASPVSASTAPNIASFSNNPVRVAIANGPESSFVRITRGLAPFVKAGAAEADLVWDVAGGQALSRGDPIIAMVDGSLLGTVIDRTWAIKEVQNLSRSRVLEVRMRVNGKSYRYGDRPTLVVSGIKGRYLTVVNIAADGTLQLLFPFFPEDNARMAGDEWTYSPRVDAPFGADHLTVVATERPATDFLAWMKAENAKRKAALLPAALAQVVEADKTARIGTAGVYTAP